MECMNNLCNEKGLKRCTRCEAAQYCSKECQQDHWKRHKKCCKMISSSPDMRLRHSKAWKDYKIATNRREIGEFDQALKSLQDSLETFQEFQHDAGISICYYEIGHVMSSKSQYEEALVNYRTALDIFREIHGENHGRTLGCYESIGTILSVQGRHDDAFIGYGKALAIRLNLYGEHHLNTADSYFNIGIVQRLKGDFDGALVSLQKAKEIFTRDLGVKHPKTVQASAAIDLCQKRIGRVTS